MNLYSLSPHQQHACPQCRSMLARAFVTAPRPPQLGDLVLCDQCATICILIGLELRPVPITVGEMEELPASFRESVLLEQERIRAHNRIIFQRRKAASN